MNPEEPTRSHDPLARWTARRDQDAALTVTQRALVIAAQHHADRVWNMASRGELPNHPTAAAGHLWSQLTVETYEYLRDTGAYSHLSASHPQHVAVHADRVADWLATVDGGGTIAEQYGIDFTFTLGGSEIHDRIQELVTRAAADRILDTAGHRVQLWQAADEGFLLTVDPPQGPRLASRRWVDLVYADLTAREHACVNEAWQIADDANTEIAAARNDPPDSPNVRGATWCRLALAAYQRLLYAGAYAHLTPPPACTTDPDRIRTWLASPYDAGFDDTVAEVWDLGDTFTTDIEHNVSNLIDLAQTAGVWGIPGHTIRVWHLAGEAFSAGTHLVTVDTPAGASLVSADLATTDLVPEDATGTDAAVGALTTLARIVDTVLAAGRPRPVSGVPESGAIDTATAARLSAPPQAIPVATSADAVPPAVPGRGGFPPVTAVRHDTGPVGDSPPTGSPTAAGSATRRPTR